MQGSVIDPNDIQDVLPADPRESFGGAPIQPPSQQPLNFIDQSEIAQELPRWANGLSPQTAINQSPVSVEDRAKMAVGNVAGNYKFLKQNFADVQRTKEGDFVVRDQNDGLWKRVDPSGLGDGDPWKMTKELASDVIEALPTVWKTGTQIAGASATAAAAGATGGAALAAGAAVSGGIAALNEGLVTSLGRLAGTYEATQEEQLKDIGVEALLNAGGTVVAAGVKPAMGMIADGLKKSGQYLGSTRVAQGARDAFVAATGAMTGAGTKNVERLIERPELVSGAMKMAAQGGASADDVVQRLVRDNIQATGQMAKSVRPALTKMYGQVAKDVVDNVDDAFRSNIDDVVKSIYSKAADLGVGTIDDAGKFVMHSVDDLKELAKTSGELRDLLASPKSYEVIKEAMDRVASFEGAKVLTGKAGAAQAMKFSKLLNDATYELQERAADEALAFPQTLLAQFKSVASQKLTDSFQLAKPVMYKGQEVSNLFSHLNSVYSKAATQLQPMIKVAEQAVKQSSDQPFEGLMRGILADAGKSEVKQTALDSAIKLVKEYGDNSLQTIYDGILDREAARAFTPLTRPGYLAAGAGMGAAGQLLYGNAAAAAAFLGGAASSSPRLHYNVIQTALKGRQLLGSMPGNLREQMFKDPAAMNAWVQALTAPSIVHNQVFNQAMQMGISEVKGMP